MGHAHLVDFRKAHGEPDVDLRAVLVDGVGFVPQVSGGLLHAQEHLVGEGKFSHFLVFFIIH